MDPLQQYLIRFPDGRLQALGLAWDTRPRDKGGQRWFHLYPGQTLRAGDPLHWTGREQTWNFQCAECHSTGLRKGYDLATNRYATTWAERLQQDVWYVDHRSLALDCKILLLTLVKVIRQEGISPEGRVTMTRFDEEVGRKA